jgi:phosphoadenosine phosphosulfate reductase
MARWSADELATLNRRLAEQSPAHILRWAVAEFHPQLVLATAFGAEGCCLIHLLADLQPRPRFINLDTGYQFAETLAMRAALHARYGIDVELIQPDTTVAEYEAEHGGPLYQHRPDQCCHDRKIIPLRRVLAGAQAWISAIRKDQTAHRAVADVVQWDAKFGLFKVNPLLTWTKKDVWKLITEQKIPYNVLHDQGYESVGCWPCTQPGAGRAGRWAGSAKKECGLHVIEHQGGSGI